LFRINDYVSHKIFNLERMFHHFKVSDVEPDMNTILAAEKRKNLLMEDYSRTCELRTANM